MERFWEHVESWSEGGWAKNFYEASKRMERIWEHADAGGEGLGPKLALSFSGSGAIWEHVESRGAGDWAKVFQ